MFKTSILKIHYLELEININRTCQLLEGFDTGFGIPVLCHDIPGLRYTIGQYKAGVCTDMDDTESIKAAIEEMDNNYEEYSKNARTFYDSYDIKKELLNIVPDNCN